MTGYATKTVALQFNETFSASMTIHIKSLNSKYFETSCKLPTCLAELEIPIQKLLKAQLSRGHIFVSIRIHNAEDVSSAIHPSFTTIANYVDAIEKIKTKFGFTEPITLYEILRLPDSLQKNDIVFDEAILQEVLQVITSMITDIIASQQKEGENLKQDIVQQIQAMQKMIIAIKEASESFYVHKKDLLNTILFQLKAQEDDELSAQYCTLLAQKNNLISELEKIDINEEIIRFSSHLANLTDIVNSAEIIKGKKIDFTLQELNREANTIASKCSSVQISSIIIDIKSALEKAREQAHNIF